MLICFGSCLTMFAIDGRLAVLTVSCGCFGCDDVFNRVRPPVLALFEANMTLAGRVFR